VNANEFDLVIKQLERLESMLLLPNTDFIWSNYSNADEALKDLDFISLKNGLLKKDKKYIDRLLFLLAPTNDLQEISISSGWGSEFCKIAKTIEIALERYNE